MPPRPTNAPPPATAKSASWSTATCDAKRSRSQKRHTTSPLCTSIAVSAGSPLATITSLPARRRRKTPPRRAAKRHLISPPWRSIAARCRAPSLTISIRGRPGALTTAPEALVPTRGARRAVHTCSPVPRSWSRSCPSGSSRARPSGVITETARSRRAAARAARRSGRRGRCTSRAAPTISRSPQRNVDLEIDRRHRREPARREAQARPREGALAALRRPARSTAKARYRSGASLIFESSCVASRSVSASSRSVARKACSAQVRRLRPVAPREAPDERPPEGDHALPERADVDRGEGPGLRPRLPARRPTGRCRGSATPRRAL